MLRRRDLLKLFTGLAQIEVKDANLVGKAQKV